jgi:hypothetical protein
MGLLSNLNPSKIEATRRRSVWKQVTLSVSCSHCSRAAPINAAKCVSWLVSLLAISSCFFASLSVTGSAVGFVTTSAINRTCETSLDHYFSLTGLNAYQPKTDWQAIPIFQKDQVHRLDHNANVTVCDIRRNARRNLTSTQASNSRDVTAGSAIAKGCNDL